MPVDETNPPFSRSRNKEAPLKVGNPKGMIDNSLKEESILLEEMNFISVTAYQLKEERSRLFNLYLIIIGLLTPLLATLATFSSAIQIPIGQSLVPNPVGESLQTNYLKVPDFLYLASGILFLVSFVSYLFFRRLVHVTQKYRKSLYALNKIKAIYLERMPELKRAFHWRLDTIPEFGGVGSAISLMGTTVALIGSIYGSGGIWVLLRFLGPPNFEISISDWIFLICVIPFLLLLWRYRIIYQREKKRSIEELP
jgi:hypothetical protein